MNCSSSRLTNVKTKIITNFKPVGRAQPAAGAPVSPTPGRVAARAARAARGCGEGRCARGGGKLACRRPWLDASSCAGGRGARRGGVRRRGGRGAWQRHAGTPDVRRKCTLCALSEERRCGARPEGRRHRRPRAARVRPQPHLIRNARRPRVTHRVRACPVLPGRTLLQPLRHERRALPAHRKEVPARCRAGERRRRFRAGAPKDERVAPRHRRDAWRDQTTA
jgi:hypothetical protein